jgi:hypothetical protein
MRSEQKEHQSLVPCVHREPSFSWSFGIERWVQCFYWMTHQILEMLQYSCNCCTGKDLLPVMLQLIHSAQTFRNLCRKETWKKIKYAMPMSLNYTGKANQQEPLHLKERSVFPGINHLKKALWSWSQAETCRDRRNQNTTTVQGYWRKLLSSQLITTRKEHGWTGKFFKIGSTSILFQKFGLYWTREDYHRKQCCC